MIVGVLRILAVAIWAGGLWALWRSMGADRAAATIVGLGFAARALAGAALFWISYLALPLAESLQQGIGLWFFALDAAMYFGYADLAAAEGLAAIRDLSPTLPNVFYLRALAATIWLVGPAVSASLILNLTAFLVTCAVFIRIADQTGAAREAKLFALGFACLTPSWLLWTTQPLKDTLFLALVAGYVLTMVWWTNATRSGAWRWQPIAAAFAAQWMVLYAISGIRWYFALMLLTATLVSWFVTLWRRPGRRVAAAVPAAALFAILVQAVPVGAGPYLPEWGHDVLRPWAAERGMAAILEVPRHVVDVADRLRAGLLASEGGTEIRLAPRADEPVEAALPPAPAPVEEQPVLVETEPESDAAGGLAESRLPVTAVEKLFASTVAMFVPRAVAQSAGWIEIGGGRGLWVFADLDTVVFTSAFLAGIVLVVVQWRRGMRPHPVFWGVAILTVLIGGLLTYEGGNFGTLFRQRNMVMLEFLLVPLLMERRRGPGIVAAPRKD